MDAIDGVRAARIIIVLAFLLYACKLDLESRIVPNRVWKWMLITCLPLTALEIYLLSDLLTFKAILFMLFQFAVISALSYAFYLLRAFGGADVKALISLSLIFPLYPELFGLPIFQKIGIFAFATLSNSVIAAPVIALLYFVRNLVREGVRGFVGNPLYYFVGVRVDPKNVPKHHYLLEFIDESGKAVRVRRAVEPDEEILRRTAEKMDRIWVTPALPFLVFITAGYIAAVVFGNLPYALMAYLFPR